jgi:hypothetical protein
MAGVQIHGNHMRFEAPTDLLARGSLTRSVAAGKRVGVEKTTTMATRTAPSTGIIHARGRRR